MGNHRRRTSPVQQTGNYTLADLTQYIVPVTNLNKQLHSYTKVLVELNNMYLNIGANNGSKKF
jgi:hypothetical protein